jgi:hypothetical protein
MDFQTVIYLWTAHKWTGLFIIIVGYLVQLTRPESKFPVQVAPRWRPVIAAILAMLLTGAQALTGGLPWRDVVLRGLATGFVTMGLFDLLVNAFCNGRVPNWLAWLAAMTPQPPPPPATEKAISIKPPPDDRPTEKTIVPELPSKGPTK